MTGFRKVYPSRDRIRFDGGMNSKFDKSLIEDNQSPDCQNVRFTNGGPVTRGGTTKLGTAAVAASHVGDGIYTRHTDDGQETMVVFAGTHMKYWDGNTFVTVPSAQSMFTAGLRVGAAEMENYLFICNGGQIPYKYNGDFTRHGVYAPTASAVAASGDTGSLTGDYRYVYTVVNSGLVESDYSPVMATFTAASATIHVSGIATFAPSFGVNARKIYRTTAGGTTYKLLTTLSNNTATTYDDNTADASLGANAPDDQGVPPKYTVVRYHKGRLFVNDSENPNYLWYSEIDNPFVFKATNFIKIGDNTSDLIYGIESFEDHILVNCSKSQHIIYMPDADPDNWSPVRVQSPYGSKSPHGCFAFNDKIMVPAMENGKFVGFAPIGGAAVQPSSTFLTLGTVQSLLASDPIEPEMLEVQEGYVGNISAIVFNGIGYISVTSGDLQTTNNKVWVFDFSLGKEGGRNRYAWSPDTGVNAAQFTIYGSKLYFITSTAPCYVNEYETITYNDNGSAIDSYFWTKEFSADGNSATPSHKDFRYIKLLTELAGDYNMRLFVRVDSDSGDGDSRDVNLRPGGSLWGTAIWGTSLWGGGSDQEDKKIFLGGTRGERIQFRFSNNNTANQKFGVRGLRFYFNERGWR